MWEAKKERDRGREKRFGPELEGGTWIGERSNREREKGGEAIGSQHCPNSLQDPGQRWGVVLDYNTLKVTKYIKPLKHSGTCF